MAGRNGFYSEKLFYFILIIYLKYGYSSAGSSQEFTPMVQDLSRFCSRNQPFVLAPWTRLIIEYESKYDSSYYPMEDVFYNYSIITLEGYSLMANIGEISIKKNRKDECLDYVTFKTKSNNHVTKKVCQYIDSGMKSVMFNKNDFSFVNEGSDTLMAAYDRGGKIETSILLSGLNFKRHNDRKLVIVYTPYERCHDEGSNDCISKLPNNVYIENTGRICSSGQLCSFCTLETNCQIEQTNSMMFPISIIFCLVCTAVGLWINKKNILLCGYKSRACPNDTPIQTASDVLPITQLQNLHSSNNQSSRRSRSDSLAADLPPSYNSLFATPPEKS